MWLEYMQNYMMLRQKCNHILASVTWFDEGRNHVGLVAWLYYSFAFTSKLFYLLFSTLSTVEAVCPALQKTFRVLMDEELEILYDHGCFQSRDLVGLKGDEKAWICSSYPFRHITDFTVQSRRQIVLVNAYCSTWNCEFCIMNSFVKIYVIEFFKLTQHFFRDSFLSEWA